MTSPVLSRWERHARTGLWVVAGLILAVLVVAAAVGFRSHPASPRSKVAAYIVDANRIELGARPQILRIQSAYSRFSRNLGNPSRQQHDLVAAERNLRALRARVAALSPPSEARRLHSLLLQLFDVQVAFAADVTDLARYLPLLAKAQAPLATANATLRRRVRAARRAAGQAQAFDDYGARTKALAAHVGAIQTPPLFTPLRDAEAQHLRDLSRRALQVGVALDRHHAARATALFSSLAKAAAAPTVAVAQREAVLEYNRRLKAVTAVADAVSRERRRLDRKLA